MKFPSTFRFCPHCGSRMHDSSDTEVKRGKCSSCGWTHYRNPTVGVAVILIEDEQMLIGRRRDGDLCIPCGHVEWGESIEQAACREFEEETGLQIELGAVFTAKSNFHEPERQTVGIWFHGTRVSGELQPGGDMHEVGFVHLSSMPSLKFPTDNEVVATLRSARGR